MLKEKQQLGQKHLTEFVEKLKTAAGSNLVCVAVYGSAASDEFHAEFSDVNLLCVVRELSSPHLQSLAPAIQWWTDNRFPAPLVFSRQEIERAADVFPIESSTYGNSTTCCMEKTFFRTSMSRLTAIVSSLSMN